MLIDERGLHAQGLVEVACVGRLVSTDVACIITLKFIIVREGSLFLSRLRKTSIIVALKRRDFGHFKMNAFEDREKLAHF